MDGVNPSTIVADETAPTLPLLQWLSLKFAGISISQWADRFEQGLILDAQGHPVDGDTRVNVGARIFYYRSVASEFETADSAPIIYEDAHLVVADKPHGLATVPSGAHLKQTLLYRLQQQLACPTLIAAHRLDRDTAGLVVLIKHPADRNAYHALFRDRAVVKYYQAIAPFKVSLITPYKIELAIETGEHFMQMHTVQGSANSTTIIRSITQLLGHPTHALYELEPLTGLRHQLRVHMSSLGAPILGDRIYPDLLEPSDTRASLKLLAKRLQFKDPITGIEHSFESARELVFD
jgi:tRNA pseudouridine32 synthase / 23S rRNA pseudouridine746 synthase